MKKVALVILSIILPGIMLVPLTLDAHPEEEHRCRGIREHHEYHNILAGLNLDENIIKKIQQTKLEHAEKMIDLKSKIQKKHLEMHEVLMDDKLDTGKLLKINREISDLRTIISEQALKNKIEVYSLIPDDKKEEARRFIFHRMFGKGHHEIEESRTRFRRR